MGTQGESALNPMDIHPMGIPKNSKWYPMKTAMSIVQACGRSVRTHDDTAITYILDSDWLNFYNRNRDVFPNGFKETIVK